MWQERISFAPHAASFGSQGFMWVFTSNYNRLAAARLTGCHLEHMEQRPAVWYSTVRVTGGMTASKWHHLSHSFSQTSSGLQEETQHRLYLHLQPDTLHLQHSCWVYIHFTLPALCVLYNTLAISANIWGFGLKKFFLTFYRRNN